MGNNTITKRFNCNYTVDADGYNDFATIEDLREAIREWTYDKDDYQNDSSPYYWCFNTFCHVFGNFPNRFTNVPEDVCLHPKCLEYMTASKVEEKRKLTEEILGPDKGNLDIYNTAMNIIDTYKNNQILYRSHKCLIMITNDFTMIKDEDDLTFYYKRISFFEKIKDCYVYGEKDKTAHYKYAVFDRGMCNTQSMPVHHNDVVLSELYNDDLPHEKVMDFLKSDNPGLIILHGEPGTGKTSYIRHLIEQFPDNKFMLLDSSMFNHITDASFIHLLLDNPNTAIILEDCEAMVTEDARDMRTNNISTLLNLTDGIIGDSFNMKFICTFNTEVSKIDSALLRKGRLKLKYEFMKLKKDKIEAIAVKRGLTLPKAEDMTLADIMNYGDANGGENKKPNAIGFVQ